MTAPETPPRELVPLFVDIHADGRDLRLEYAWIDGPRVAAPLMVFLHQGLGSVSAWKDLPQALCTACGMRGLAYSRDGNGRSTRGQQQARRPVDFMHRHARHVLPALLDALAIDVPVWLFGHSDGASIALLFAAAFPRRVHGVIAVAPHIMVEAISIASIEELRTTYATGELKARLARHHDDPDAAFHGWSDVWLDPAFRAWSIETELNAIACPVLAIQGEADPYGTMAQIEGIAQRVATACLVKMPDAGHAPFRDEPLQFMAAVAAFLDRLGVRADADC